MLDGRLAFLGPGWGRMGAWRWGTWCGLQRALGAESEAARVQAGSLRVVLEWRSWAALRLPVGGGDLRLGAFSQAPAGL